MVKMDDLFTKVRDGDEHEVRHLILCGHDVNALNDYDETPLVTMHYKRPKIVKLLLDAGANPNLINRNGLSPLHLATIFNDLRSVKLLLSAGAFINAYEDDGWTALHYAVKLNHEVIAKTLLKEGASVNHYECNWSILSLAGKKRNSSIVRKLLLHDADVNFENSDGSTALHNLGWVKDSFLIKMIVRRSIDVNNQDQKGRTALHFAAANGNFQMCKLLLDRGADVGVTTFNMNDTPLHRAAQCIDGDEDNERAIIELFLDRGADPDALDRNRSTPVLFAAQNLGTPALEVLMRFGADFNARDADGATVLHYAVENRITVIDFLLDNGIDSNSRSNSGMSALHYAVLSAPILMSRHLLDRGFDVHAKSNSGKTPLGIEDVPLESQNLLLEYMAEKHSIGVEVDQIDRELISNDETLQEYFDRCVKELENMKKTNVFGNLTIYSIFMARENKIIGYARNKDLVKAVTNKKRFKEFPIFFNTIWTKLSNEVRKHKRKKKATKFLDDIFNKHDPAGIVSREVIRYLKDEDIIFIYQDISSSQ